MTKIIKRGDLYYADLAGNIGSEQGGTRPVLVVQNDIGNKNSPTTIVVSVTSKKTKANLPTHVPLPEGERGLKKPSLILTEQLRTIDRTRLVDFVANIGKDLLEKVDYALSISVGLKK